MHILIVLKKKRYDFLCKNMEYTGSNIIKKNVGISNILISHICVTGSHSKAECESGRMPKFVKSNGWQSSKINCNMFTYSLCSLLIEWSFAHWSA